MLATLIDEVRQTNVLLVSVNTREGSPRPKLVPMERPTSAITKLAGQSRHDQRMKAHDDLVARLTPKPAKQD